MERYRVERIGRIASLWHLAKHVVIYERAVSASADDDPAANSRHDNAVREVLLRKVDEFVEILQPQRSYPPGDRAPVATAGVIVRAEFVSTRIRVDGQWGGNVRDEVWQLPLWKRTLELPGDPANPHKASGNYPKPLVVLQIADEFGALTPHELDEAEKLIFYTSLRPDETAQNVDTWRPVQDIDLVSF
jgi:hypothetical protein